MNTSPNDPLDDLRRLGEAGEGPYNIALAALILGGLDHPRRSLEPFHGHLREMAEKAQRASRLAVSADDAARCLAELIAGHYGYDGDRLAYDDPQNANLISVIERRRGMPVALGILYIHAARAAGFQATGLNSPGHFLLRVTIRSSEILVDPFNGGATLESERLGALPGLGIPTPEDNRPSEPVGDIDVLLRLENNLKVRALQNGERVRALEIAKRMVLIGPRRPDLWIELGRFNESAGALGAAQKAFEACLSLVPPGQPLHNEAALSLHALKRR